MLNQTVLMGRLTATPEIKYTQGNNTAILRFTLAVERDYQKQGEEKATDFIQCIAFGKTAEFIQKYFNKGSMIAVIGRIQTGSYTNQDGQKIYTTDVVAEKVSFTGEKREKQQGNQPQPTPANGGGFMQVPDDLDDLPFN